MKRIYLFSLAIAIFSNAMTQVVTEEETPISPKVQVSFAYPIGSGGTNSINETYQVSLNILAGATGGIQGVEMAGFANYTNGKVSGVQMAGFCNVIKDSLNGAQMAGFSNFVGGSTEGLQAAGFTNVSLKDHHGAQLGGFANVIVDSLRGAQVAGFSNVATSKVTGIQAAGFANYASEIKGSQIAGFANVSSSDMTGHQLAGFGNVATGNSTGIQIAGFVNVANKLKGAQLGFINVADSLDGIAVGFFSFSKNGYHQLELSANETFQSNLSFKTGSNAFYNIFTTGIHWGETEALWSVGYGVGTRKELGNHFSVNADITSHSILSNLKDYNDWESLNKLQLSAARSFNSGLEVFAGASLNMWVSQRAEPYHDYLFSKKYSGHSGATNWILYPGFQLGIRI